MFQEFLKIGYKDSGRLLDFLFNEYLKKLFLLQSNKEEKEEKNVLIFKPSRTLM